MDELYPQVMGPSNGRLGGDGDQWERGPYWVDGLLPEKPLRHWTFWAEYRAGDNLQAVYWLYNLTGDAFLLDLAGLFAFSEREAHGPLLQGIDTISFGGRQTNERCLVSRGESVRSAQFLAPAGAAKYG